MSDDEGAANNNQSQVAPATRRDIARAEPKRRRESLAFKVGKLGGRAVPPEMSRRNRSRKILLRRAQRVASRRRSTCSGGRGNAHAEFNQEARPGRGQKSLGRGRALPPGSASDARLVCSANQKVVSAETSSLPLPT